MTDTLQYKNDILASKGAIAFTICANNYLAHAKNLAVSFKKYHPSVHFVIAILDQPNEGIAYRELGADEILWVDTLLKKETKELYDRYGIAELCTVVKPELIQYFFKREAEVLLYIDPDIEVFSPFEEVFEQLGKNDMVLTPHICSPTGDVGHPQDKHLMRTGIYNLGFLAIKNTPEINSFIAWWDKRVKAYGYHDLKKGYFYDQIWLGFGPAFLDRVFILRHLGYNAANWNLHERELITKEGNWYVNSTENPLRFFHFSHFKIDKLPIIASYNENFNTENRKDIEPLFLSYKQSLLNYNFQELQNVDYAFGLKPKPEVIARRQSKWERAWKLFKKSVKTVLRE